MTLRTKTLTAVAALTIFAGGYTFAQDAATTEQPAETQQPAADAGASTATPAEESQAEAGATETEAAEEPAAEADEAGAEEPAAVDAAGEEAPAEAEAGESEPAVEPAEAAPADAAAEEPAAEEPPADAEAAPADAADEPAADAAEAPAEEPAAAEESPAEAEATESVPAAEPAEAEVEEPATNAATTEEAPAEAEATEEEPAGEPAEVAEEEPADAAATEEAPAEEGAAEEGAAEEEHAESGGGHGGHIEDISFSFEGPFGKYDQFQLQRGLQVYTEVCAACHGMKFVPLRTLSDDGGPGLPEDQVRAYAEQMTIIDKDTGEERPRLPTDNFPENNDAGAPDLSLMAKARAGFHGPHGTGVNQLVKGIGGPEYIHAILTGYTGEEMEQAGTVLYENSAFSSGYIGMTPPLSDDLVTYEDGTEATVDQMARDVAAFLMWTAEPKLTARKEVGLTSVLFLIVLASLLYLTNKKIWAPHKGKLKD